MHSLMTQPSEAPPGALFDSVEEAFRESSRHFPTALQEFQFYDKYSRYDYGLGRRETWIETVKRAVDYLRELSEDRLDSQTYRKIYDYILDMKVMPSMRLLAMAGPAARRTNIAIYNCSFMGIDSIDSFVEALIISMAGCGVGFSVESQFTSKLPKVKKQIKSLKVPTYIVGDSAEGWASALRVGLEHWFSGLDVEFDYSHIRPAGAPLKTKGGQASGPIPLFDMLQSVRRLILARQGSFLRSIDVHDIMCHVGNAAVSGGMRRTAMISLFDYDDPLMLNAKNGQIETQRWNANNSAVWTENLTREQFEHQFRTMNDSMSGEPGIFNRPALTSSIPDRRKSTVFGSNPCGEIILRPNQFCNLSAAIARADDTPQSLAEKIEVATIIGTIQSMATYFPGLRSVWEKNCEEERLLGVDITGQMDCKAVQNKETQRALKDIAIRTNQDTSSRLDISPSVAITCVKPSGNTSVFANCSSGLNARWSPYYLRNVTVAVTSPLYKVLKSQNVPMTPRVGAEDNAAIVHFPVKSPDGAITRKDRTAIEQCEYWLKVKQNWTEHNPSVTITYQPDEFEALTDWVWEHRSLVGGLSFYPADDAVYEQAPNEEIDKETYERLALSFPKIDFSQIVHFEYRDETTAAQEIACVSGRCDV